MNDPVPDVPEWLSVARSRLFSLPDHAGPGVGREAIRHAAFLLSSIEAEEIPTPVVTLNLHGFPQLKWSHLDRSVTLTVFPSHSESVVNDTTFTRVPKNDAEIMRRLLAWMFPRINNTPAANVAAMMERGAL